MTISKFLFFFFFIGDNVKKTYLISILILTLLFAVSSVSASENATDVSNALSDEIAVGNVEKISEDTVKRMDKEGKITKTEEQYQGALQRFGDWLGKASYKVGQDIGNAAINIGNGVHSFFNNKKGSAFVLPDGSYYDLDGNHYDAKHHLIKAKEKTLDELLKMKFIMY